MKIEQRKVKVRDLVDRFSDDGEGGVSGFKGTLDIRPPYQREFVYKDRQRDAVIDTIQKGFPLNVLYWADRGDGTYEVMDGQQRTISICQYVTGKFSRDYQYFHNLTQGEQDAILDYELMVYVCTGSDRDKLDWFQVINIAGEKLTAQELRNAVYHGTWLADAKKYFSRPSAPAAQLGSDYVSGSPIRQDYLEKALTWIAQRDKTTIEGYMALHQHDKNAGELWRYYQSVIAWAKSVFPEERKELRSVDWGTLFNAHEDDDLDAATLEADVTRLMQDEDVTRKAGIYAYLVTGHEKHLSLRTFTDRQKREAFERQQGICPTCGDTFTIAQMEADHITPWSKGGRTTSENCQMLCADDNRRKSNV